MTCTVLQRAEGSVLVYQNCIYEYLPFPLSWDLLLDLKGLLSLLLSTQLSATEYTTGLRAP